MGDRIDFEAKSDRELLVLTAQAVNALMEADDQQWSLLRSHDRSITRLQTLTTKILPLLVGASGGGVGLWKLLS